MILRWTWIFREFLHQRSCELSLAKPHEAWRLGREEAPSTGAVLRDGSHMLTACYDASGTALGKRTIQMIRPIGAEGLNRRPPWSLAGCFLALGSGLGLVGTASARR